MMEKSEMLKQKKCCCISINTATFIFGVISAVIFGCGVIAFATARYWLGALEGNEDYEKWLHDSDSIHIPPTDEKYRKRMMTFTQIMIYVLYLLFICLVSFIFSVFLCYGTKRRQPGFVKAYLVYGVVAAILMMARAVLLVTMGDVVDGIIGLVVCGVYSLILLMVKHTYETIRAEQTNISEKMLPEPCMKA